MNDRKNEYPHKQSQYSTWREKAEDRMELSSYREDTGSEKVRTTIPVQDCCTRTMNCGAKTTWRVTAHQLNPRPMEVRTGETRTKGTEEKPQPRRWLQTPQMGNWTVENESGGDPSPSPKASKGKEGPH